VTFFPECLRRVGDGLPSGLVESLSDGRQGQHLINLQTEAEKRVRPIRLDMIKVALSLGKEPELSPHPDGKCLGRDS
jgi:hypothetical protein